MTTTSSTNEVDIRADSGEPPSWLDAASDFVFSVLRALGAQRTEISILVVDLPTMTDLNRRYRNVDGPTDVLTFVHQEAPLAIATSPGEQGPPGIVGDIVINPATIEKQAERFNVPIEEEMRRVLIHGVLHAYGHTHATTDPTVEPMLQLQERVLADVHERLW